VPTQNRSQTAGPVDLFRTKDGWILVQVIGQPLFKRWARLMGEEHWLTDPRFKDDISRGDNGAAISERMSRWCAQYSTAEALDTLAKAKIPSGPRLQTAADSGRPAHPAGRLLPAHRVSRRAEAGPDRQGPCVAVDDTRLDPPSPPTLGEHTDQILASLGYDKKAIAALRQKRVI
jgi:crotonobetainyl-CoA:carnitine CoA-transferase CaiB-like acyl-CoA transferase